VQFLYLYEKVRTEDFVVQVFDHPNDFDAMKIIYSIFNKKKRIKNKLQL
jgi:hypothetical protein